MELTASMTNVDDSEPAKTSAPEQDESHVVHVSGMSRRLVAALVDLLILAPVLAACFWLTLKVSSVSLRAMRIEALLELFIEGRLGYVLLAVTSLVGALYSVLFISFLGRTPGLGLMRARIIDPYGNRPAWWRVLLRAVGKIISFGLLGLGLLWIAFDREKRGLHDWLAGTYVIKRR